MDKVVISSKYMPIFDQQGYKSCAATATITLIHHLLEAEDVYSVMYTYYAARKFEGTTDRDCGTRIKSIMRAISTYGVLSVAEWDNSLLINNFDNLYINAKHLIGYTPTYIEHCNINNIYTALSNNIPFVFGASLYTSFDESVKNDGIISCPDTQIERCVGRHAMLGVGLTQIDNKWYVKVQNSRGVNWGNNGYCYMPIQYITDINLITECWTILPPSVKIQLHLL